MPDAVLAVLTPRGPELVDPAAPVLRADDLGVLRGESVFETCRVVAGRAAFLSAHLARLARSADRVDVAVPSGLEDLVLAAVSAWGDADEGALRVVVTKGSRAASGQAFALVAPVPPEAVASRAGVSVVTLSLGVPAEARAGAPWLLGGVKSTSYAVNMATLRAAEAMGADDVIWTSSDGEVLEAPTATVCWSDGERLVTPPADEVGVLRGTTLDAVRDLGVVEVVERRTSVDDLRSAAEVLLLSSVRGVAPVVRLDGRDVGRGPLGRAVQEAFEDRLRSGQAC